MSSKPARGAVDGADAVVVRYRSASQRGDVEQILALLSPDAELVSPISDRMIFRGADLETLLRAVYGSLSGLRWLDQIGQGHLWMLRGEARIAGVGLDDAMVLELDDDCRIHRIRPHFRPWLGLTLFALVIGLRLGRHPGVLIRAWFG